LVSRGDPLRPKKKKRSHTSPKETWKKTPRQHPPRRTLNPKIFKIQALEAHAIVSELFDLEI